MMVDGSVVVVENVYRHLSEHPPGASVSRTSIVLKAAKEVAQPVLFGILIIILVFLPILTLQGMEGKMFKPLAYTIMIALLVSLLLSLTLSPALCSMALTRGTEEDPWLLRKAKQWYAPSLSWALTHRRVVLSAAVAMLGASLALFPFLGGEFIPILNEAAITPQTIRLPSISLDKSIEIEMEMQRAVMEFPEVRMVVSKIGRSELGNDPQEPNASDPVVSLKPMEEWKTAKTKPELDDAIRRRIERVPGANFLLSQPIQQRVDELLSAQSESAARREPVMDGTSRGCRSAAPGPCRTDRLVGVDQPPVSAQGSTAGTRGCRSRRRSSPVCASSAPIPALKPAPAMTGTFPAISSTAS